MSFLTNLPKVLADSGEEGIMEYDIFKINIKNLYRYESQLVKNDNFHYKKQLLPQSDSDPYCTNALFETYEKVKDII